ncbi:hypothetical protein AK812_SmicGene29233, partial [Symbiodinium microadriaticum]
MAGAGAFNDVPVKHSGEQAAAIDSEQQPLAVAGTVMGQGIRMTAGLAEKSAEEAALDIFHRISDDEGVVRVAWHWEEEEAMTLRSVAVQQKGPEPAQVKEMIRKEVESILGADEVADDTPLMDTGLDRLRDSLSSVQFRNDLTRDFNVKLSDAWNKTTIGEAEPPHCIMASELCSVLGDAAAALSRGELTE